MRAFADGYCCRVRARQASRPPTAFYGESVRVSTARPLAARQTKAASRAALSARCEIGDSLVRVDVDRSPSVYMSCVRVVPCHERG